MSSQNNLSNLLEKIEAERRENFSRIPPHLLEPVRESVKTTITSFTPSTTLSVGDVVPDFELPNATNKNVKLSDILAEHNAVVLIWYRGGWCPYCSRVLLEYGLMAHDFKQYGARIVGISPELPDESISTSQKLGLRYDVLSDRGLKVAEQYGVSWIVEEKIIETYNALGVRLKEINGNDDNKNSVVRLPVPATFVIDKNMKLVYSFVNPDYTKRADPNDALKAVMSISS